MDVTHVRTESSTSARESLHSVDARVVKTHYPRDNNSKILSFVIQEEPNLCLDFNSITFGCRVELPSDQLPDNGLAMKMFRNMNIEINSQLITSTKAS
jgi:hypothetical protein